MSGTELLLDTNVVIGLLKGYAPAVALAETAQLTLDRAAVSQITRMELLGFPSLTEDEEHAIRGFLSGCRVCLLDERIEAEAIRLRRSGGLKLPDAIIAATALIHGYRFLTLDGDLLNRLQQLGYHY
jgi:predicted nucleic acid-binding protein